MQVVNLLPETTTELTGLVSATFAGMPDETGTGEVLVMLNDPNGPDREQVMEIVATDPNYIGLGNPDHVLIPGCLIFALRSHELDLS